jgi:hypothetical protein
MMGGSYSRTVQVSGKPLEISVHQKSKSVWEAVGAHNGETYRSTGRSMSQAMTALVRQIEYHFHQN